MYYTGIGARITPISCQEIMKQMGEYLAKKGYTLRSGGAEGADVAFEIGCDKAGGSKEIYLPWSEFNGSNSDIYTVGKSAYDLARQFHLSFDNLSSGTQKLIARDGYEVFGNDIENGDYGNASKFIICYTQKGAGEGGTGQALRIANAYKIPVLDMGFYEISPGIFNNKKIEEAFNSLVKSVEKTAEEESERER